MATIINFSDFINTTTTNGSAVLENSPAPEPSFQVCTADQAFQKYLVSEEPFESELPEKTKYAAEPLKNIEDIYRVEEYMIQHGRFRDNLIFTAGVNFGLRCGDLMHLRFGDFLNPDGTFKEKISLIEQKTRKTNKATKVREVYMNSSVREAAVLYFNSLDHEINLNEYVFTSMSNNSGNGKPLTRYSVERILKDVINDKLGIDVHAGTHLMRHTFAYHVIGSYEDRSRALEFLQKTFNHSAQSITLQYAGITDDEMEHMYKNLNLGMGTGLNQFEVESK